MTQTGNRTVLVAFHDPLLNGATISTLRAVPLLEEMGWSFAFWVPRPGPAYDHLRDRGATVEGLPRPIVSGLKPLRLPPGPWRRIAATPAYLRAYLDFLHRAQPAVVHANSLFSFAEAVTARAADHPTLIQLHDMAPKSWKAKPAAEICRRGAHRAIAISDACARSYRSGDWMPSVVHGGAPIPAVPADTRDRPRPFVVGTVGVISRRKATDVYIEAAARVLQGSTDVEFHLIGAADDPLDRDWAQDVVARALGAGIRYQEKANVLEAMRNWDAFVLPSRMDPFPIVMLEAMASGLPVIGARSDGIAEQVTPECGTLVPSDDPAALAAAIVAMAETPTAMRASLGAAGRRRVAAKFNLERQAEGLSRAYEEVVTTVEGTRRWGRRRGR